jgi:hypothetical protein
LTGSLARSPLNTKPDRKPKKAEREKRIMSLVGNKQEQILLASQTNFSLGIGIYRSLGGVGFMVLACFLIILKYQSSDPHSSLGFKIFLILTVLAGLYRMLEGLLSVTEAFNNRQILDEVKDRESKLKT